LRTRKKGQLTLVAAVEVLVAVSIALLFVYVGRSWGNGDAVQKTRTARELSLLSDSMLSMQGNSFINYPVDVSDFDFHLIDNRIQVYNVQEDPTMGSYEFVGIGDEPLDKVTQGSELLIISKVNDMIALSSERPSLDKIKCVDAEVVSSSRKILINPIYDDPNKIRRLNSLATMIQSAFPGSMTTFQNPDSTEKHVQDVQKFIQDNSIDIVINLAMGEYSDLRQTVKVYYSYESMLNKRLGCLIVNEVIDGDVGISGSAIVPTNLIPILHDNNDKIAVQIEVGNVNVLDGNILDDDVSDINKGIVEGIKKLYMQDG